MRRANALPDERALGTPVTQGLAATGDLHRHAAPRGRSRPSARLSPARVVTLFDRVGPPVHGCWNSRSIIDAMRTDPAPDHYRLPSVIGAEVEGRTAIRGVETPRERVDVRSVQSVNPQPRRPWRVPVNEPASMAGRKWSRIAVANNCRCAAGSRAKSRSNAAVARYFTRLGRQRRSGPGARGSPHRWRSA